MRLTPQLRFKSFNTPWYQEKLGKLTIFKSGNTPSKSNHSFWGGDIPWISASSMHGVKWSSKTVHLYRCLN
ncbi:hypothetical protein C9J21_21480 [Photobacterium phosphoreum]|nr:hypothetical protein C9J21_21480 [Photobacterium phosphoreum]